MKKDTKTQKIRKVYIVLIILLFIVVCINLVIGITCFRRVKQVENDIYKMQSQRTSYIQSTSITEGDAYKLMYENLKDTNSRIIDTIYWALSAIGATIFAIIGANVFFNMNINKKEINSIKDNLTANIEEIKSDMNNYIQSRIDEYIKKSDDKLNGDIIKVEKDQKAQNELLSERTNSKVDSITEKLTNIININDKKQDGKYEELNRIIKNNIVDIKIDLYDCIAEQCDMKKVYTNAAIFYVRKGEMIIDRKRDLEVTLKQLIEVLEKVDNLGYYCTEITNFVNKIPDNNYIQRETLKKSLQAIMDRKDK